MIARIIYRALGIVERVVNVVDKIRGKEQPFPLKPKAPQKPGAAPVTGARPRVVQRPPEPLKKR